MRCHQMAVKHYTEIKDHGLFFTQWEQDVFWLALQEYQCLHNWTQVGYCIKKKKKKKREGLYIPGQNNMVHNIIK